MRAAWLACGLAAFVWSACGDNVDPVDPVVCESVVPGPGSSPGHADPLGAGADQARAGVATAAMLPALPTGLENWKPGDFILANNKVAMVIEDVGDSNLYDPWGGRPIGAALVQDGAMVSPADFGEMFLLLGRTTMITEDVSVVNDGSDGNPAVIRTIGRLHPVPFFDALVVALFADDYADVSLVIDYELAPGAEAVNIRYQLATPRTEPINITNMFNALMFTKRAPTFAPTLGYVDSYKDAPWVAMITEGRAGIAYIPPEPFAETLTISGFTAALSGPGVFEGNCVLNDRLHARVVIGGPGADGVGAAVARTLGEATRVVTGTVTRDGEPAADVHVHALGSTDDTYLTRATTAADGTYSMTVPATAAVRLEAFRWGDQIATTEVAAAANVGDLDLPATGEIVVSVEDGDTTPLPARIQVFPAEGQTVPTVPPHYGETYQAEDRLHTAYTVDGTATLRVPPGRWEVVVSRGFEYEIDRRELNVNAGQSVNADAILDRVVDTTGAQCGDFHVHTFTSPDSGDSALAKVTAAVADGVEVPLRTDHEWINDFSAEVAQLGVSPWMAVVAGVELTSMQVWGHMNMFPLVADPTAINNGAPIWQEYPTAADPLRMYRTLLPPEVFDTLRARPEQPAIIINHPRGPANYFTFVGYDPATGMVDDVASWDTDFLLVEVFNDSSWTSNRDGTVEDWMGLIRGGRKIVAVGSSDSHGLATSPVGYPRTCVEVSTDDPAALSDNELRDQLSAGHAIVSGGAFVKVTTETGEGPGDTATGLGANAMIHIEVQAPEWVDIDTLEVIVDGETFMTLPIMPGDADPGNPVLRLSTDIQVPVRAVGGGFVVVAAHGNTTLEPVYPGRLPFGVSNAIYLEP